MDEKHPPKIAFASAIVLLVLAALCFAPSVISVVADDHHDEPDHPDVWTNGPADSFEPDRLHGLDIGDYYALWGGNEDIPMGEIEDSDEISTDYGDEEIEAPEEGEDDDGNDGEMSAENYFALYTHMDHTYRNPPESAETWNEGTNSNLSNVLGDSDTSYYPDDVTPTDYTIIKDAYIDFYAIQPSTTLHHDGGDTQRYVSNNGKVLTALDYRVGVPDDDVGSTSKTEYSLQSQEQKDTRLLTRPNCPEGADCELATSSGGVSETLSYSGLQDQFGGLSGTLYLEANIEVEIEERDYTRDNTSEPWVYQGNSFSTYTRSVQSSQEVSVQSLEGDVSIAVDDSPSSGQKTYYHVQAPGDEIDTYWGYLEINGEEKIRSNWKYYTARDKAWDTLTKEDESGTEQVRTEHNPVEVHAYPSDNGPHTFGEEWGKVQYGEIHSVIGSTNSQPNLGDDITVDLVNDTEYKAGNEVVGSFSDGNAWPADNLRLYGLVRGENIAITPDCCVELQDVTLGVKDKEWDEENDELTFTVTAMDENGNPVQTEGRTERIIINGTETYQTGPNGEAEVTFDSPPNQNQVQIMFDANEWWNLSDGQDAYKTTERPLHYGGTGFGALIGFIWAVFKLVIILLIPVWLINFACMLLGVDLWKIIKKILKKHNPFSLDSGGRGRY